MSILKKYNIKTQGKIFFHNYDVNEKSIFMKRIFILFLFILLLFFILAINLYKLQIIKFEKYNNLANKNRIKIYPLHADRGNIYDRNNIPLATNNSIYTMILLPKKVNNIENTLKKLSLIIDLDNQEIANLKKKFI